MAKEAKSDNIRQSSPAKGRGRGGTDDVTLSQQVRRCCTLVSQLLTDSAANELNRNRLVVNIRDEMKNLREEVKGQLQEVAKHITFLKGNNQRVNSTLNEQASKGRRTDNGQEEYSEETRSKNRYIIISI